MCVYIYILHGIHVKTLFVIKITSMIFSIGPTECFLFNVSACFLNNTHRKKNRYCRGREFTSFDNRLAVVVKMETPHKPFGIFYASDTFRA
jgi:hypothetical protein